MGKAGLNLSRYKKSTDPSDVGTLSFRGIIRFWYFCLQKWYKPSLTLYPSWKQKYQNYNTHRRPRVQYGCVCTHTLKCRIKWGTRHTHLVAPSMRFTSILLSWAERNSGRCQCSCSAGSSKIKIRTSSCYKACWASLLDEVRILIFDRMTEN